MISGDVSFVERVSRPSRRSVKRLNLKCYCFFFSSMYLFICMYMCMHIYIYIYTGSIRLHVNVNQYQYQYMVFPNQKFLTLTTLNTDPKTVISFSSASFLGLLNIAWHSGWWFGACVIFYTLGIIIPIDELIFFQRGRHTTNQHHFALLIHLVGTIIVRR